MPQPVHVVGQHVGPRNAAQELVHEAELALQEPDERNLAAIEMREVDAAAEDAAPRVFGVVDRAAAQHCDVARRIEGRDVDADLHGVDRGLILGVEEARVTT